MDCRRENKGREKWNPRLFEVARIKECGRQNWEKYGGGSARASICSIDFFSPMMTYRKYVCTVWIMTLET